MASTEDRVRKLVAENLEVDGKPLDASLDLNSSLSDVGVSSMDIVAFGKLVGQEFGVTISREQCPTLNSLQELIDFLDSQAV